VLDEDEDVVVVLPLPQPGTAATSELERTRSARLKATIVDEVKRWGEAKVI